MNCLRLISLYEDKEIWQKAEGIGHKAKGRREMAEIVDFVLSI